MDLFAFAGDLIKDASKVVTDSAETVVQVSGVGKVAEAIGIKVDANIHENGLNTTVTGPVAQVATFGLANRVEHRLKLKSSGGDFGGKTSAAAKDGDITIAKASAGADGRGVYGTAGIGVMVNSGFEEIKSITDVNSCVTSILNKLLNSSKGQFVRMVQDETGLDVQGFFRQVLDELLKKHPLGTLSELLLKAKGGHAKIYLDLGCSVSVGAGGTLKVGMEDEVEIQGAKQTFKMYQAGGKFGIAGLKAAIGYSTKGKTFDGFDEGIYLIVNGGAAFSVSAGIIITTKRMSGYGRQVVKPVSLKNNYGTMVTHVAIYGGHFVDSVCFTFDDGEKRNFGGNGGGLKKYLHLENGEYIVSIEGCNVANMYMGSRIKITTSNGRSIEYRGNHNYNEVPYIFRSSTPIIGIDVENKFVAEASHKVTGIITLG